MIIKRIVLIIICIFFQIQILSAEVPELKTVMPNSWQRLVQLTDIEEKEFLQINKNIIDNEKELIKTDTLKFVYGNSVFSPDYIRIYKEIFDGDIFYRVVFCAEKNPDYFSHDYQFSQILIFKNKLIAASLYNYRHEIEGAISSRDQLVPAIYSAYQSIDIIGINSKAVGVLLTNVYTKIDTNYNFIDLRKGQVHSSGGRSYFFDLTNSNIDDSLKITWTTNIYYTRFPANCLSIRNSDCLIDKNIPLKYTLQNAFDNNSATSFVENTDDDLMVIYFSKEGNAKELFTVKEFAIINGYAQNISLYNSNNRIKEIAYGTRIENVTDVESMRYKDLIDMSSDYIGSISLFRFIEKMTYSFITTTTSSGPFKPYEYDSISLSNLCLIVTDIYKGNKYNDTCIAEINIKTENGWMFGDIGD
jgi:hypothetical protein